MSEVKQIPKLRFKEFLDSWSKVLLNDIATFSKGKSISKSDIVVDGATECIRYGELYTDYNEIIEEIVSKTNLPTKDLVFSKKNDIIIPSSGETQLDIATASCVLKDDIALGGDLNIIRTKEDGLFIAYYLNSAKKKAIASLAQGNSVVHLYNHQLKGLNLNLPDLKEQQKISSFLTSVNKKIELLQHKKNLLERYKKGVLQQIFNQQLRFKDDKRNDYPDWKEARLSQISSDVNYGIGSAAKEFDGKNKYLRITDIEDSTHSFKPKPLTSPEGTIDEKYYLKENDIVFARTGASVGKSYLYKKEDGILVYAGFLIKFSIINANSKFVYYNTLRPKYWRWVSVMSMRSGQPGLNAEELKSFSFLLPSLGEQTKIANFLSAIDTKIELVNTQIENTQQFKKGLLQQMFV
ncbi:restriction endonuclease subunit S [Flavivirga sp. 57AJ16]|uniref:restriction endonuclease subunit S n=1 Tax=Flavivirga sp. 57AJ16 TaxID=3025307 RepID=UPI0023651318|nr:restriction endonuclease subunit S [Flavivirga sp. 57AJ16]MDD7886129.1 restriction endonuclease subunit S [Flavivirga sp. 57AJ16]